MLISEFLPNPIGKDQDGEFIELRNETSKIAVVDGFKLIDKKGKIFILHGEVAPNGFLVLTKKETKLALNNSDETIFLYNRGGALIDTAGFLGTAKEGASLVRSGNLFVFTDKVTMGEPNFVRKTFMLDPTLPIVTAPLTIKNYLPVYEVAGLCLAVGFGLALAAAYLMDNFYVFKK